jgi:hypothetical protein
LQNYLPTKFPSFFIILFYSRSIKKLQKSSWFLKIYIILHDSFPSYALMHQICTDNSLDNTIAHGSVIKNNISLSHIRMWVNMTLVNAWL